MLSLFGVLAVIVTSINVLNYKELVYSADETIKRLEDTGAIMPQYPPSLDITPDGEGSGRFDTMLPSDIRYLSVVYNSEGYILSIKKGNMNLDNNEALTLSEAAVKISDLCHSHSPEYAVASPDLWNRRQDSGRSGFEIMQSTRGMPPMTPADNRRIPGWRMLREYLAENDSPGIVISDSCHNLIRSLPALMFDSERSEDASGEPHSITHSPEALRYAVMSRVRSAETLGEIPRADFKFQKKPSSISEYISF